VRRRSRSIAWWSPRSGPSVTDGLWIVGFYNPCREPIELKLDLERISYWIKCGAQPTETVRSLIRKGEQQVVAG
jgi:ribosomal protein S16